MTKGRKLATAYDLGYQVGVSGKMPDESKNEEWRSGYRAGKLVYKHQQPAHKTVKIRAIINVPKPFQWMTPGELAASFQKALEDAGLEIVSLTAKEVE